MKKRMVNILMVLCTLAFVCSAGSAVYFAKAEETEQPALVMQEGASIRYFAPVGIRFVTNVSAEDYNKITTADENAEFGTLIIPNDMLNEGESLTLNTANALKIVAENWLEDTETTKSFTGVLVGTDNGDGTYANFPEEYYNRDLYAVSYCSYNDKVIYAPNPQTYSVAYIASSLLAKGDTDAFFNEIITSVFGTEKLSFAENSYTVYEEETAVTALTDAKGLKVVYSSSDESVVKVDEKGVLTGVKNGEAKITAAIGDMKATADVTVNEKQLIDLSQTQHVDVSLWDMNGDKANLLSDYPAAAEIAAMREKTVSIALPEEIKGTVKAINVGYARGEENILRGSNEDGTVNVQPSYLGCDMGEKVVTVVTDCAYYKLPMAFYTMKISNADELDAFRYYTTYQNDWKETTTAGVYAPILWDGYFVLDGNITYNDSLGEVFTDGKTYWREDNDPEKDALLEKTKKITRKYTSFITTGDINKFVNEEWKDGNGRPANLGNILDGNSYGLIGDYGFCGVFDGRGYTVKGLMIENDSRYETNVGGRKQAGGFIGMLTRKTVGSSYVYGTIRNVSFTDVIHGEWWVNGANGQIGTDSGFVYSVVHGGKCSNINVEVLEYIGMCSIFGNAGQNDDWTVQYTNDSEFKNIFVRIHHRNEVNWGTFHNPHLYNNTVAKNIYAVIESYWKKNVDQNLVGLGTGHWGDGHETLGTVTTPQQSFATDAALAKYLTDHSIDLSDWDTEYWDTSSGVPVFKTKTNV